MTNKFENIESDDVKLNKDGELEVSEELAGAIAGGFNPEEEEDEDVNNGCTVTNNGCSRQLSI
jgi:hypothetical protein